MVRGERARWSSSNIFHHKRRWNRATRVACFRRRAKWINVSRDSIDRVGRHHAEFLSEFCHRRVLSLFSWCECWPWLYCWPEGKILHLYWRSPDKNGTDNFTGYNNVRPFPTSIRLLQMYEVYVKFNWLVQGLQ